MDDYLDNSELRIKKKKKKDRKRNSSPILETVVVEENVSSPKKKKKAHVKFASGEEEEDQTIKSSPKKKHSSMYPVDNDDDGLVINDENKEPIQDGLAINDGNKEPIQDTDYYGGWPREDLQTLFERIINTLPKNDSLKYNSRVNKLEWDKIKFGSYTEEDCFGKWKFVEKKVRGYRILSEVVTDARSWLDKPWTDFYQSTKKNRHPDLPKRPLSSYMLFYIAKKNKYARKFPNLEVSKLSKLMAVKFKNLPEHKKEKYNNKAIAMREEYNEKMLKFNVDHPEAIKKGISKLPRVRTGPAKPLTPFKIFFQDKIKQIDGIKTQADLHTIQAQIKERWSTMSSKKKIPWIRWALEGENKYIEELKLYSSGNETSDKPHKSVLSKEERAILERTEGKPEKPPRSAYSLFSRIMLKDSKLKDKFDTPKGRLQEIARLWKEVPKIEKDEYAEKVKHLLANYKMEYAAYLETLPEDKKEEELANNVPKKKAKIEVTAPSLTPSKKLKQMTINSVMKKLIPNSEVKKKSKSLDELIQMEPIHPPEDSFTLFKDEYLTNGLSEKKALKAWKALSPVEIKEYDEKLETLKNEYISNFRSFLTSLKPDELNTYSNYKGNLMKEVKEEDVDEDDDDDVEDEEEEEEEEEDDDDRKSDSSEEYFERKPNIKELSISF